MRAKYEEPRAMRELHAIRVKHYEETKHLTREEYIKKVNEEAFEIMRKYNMNFKIIEKPKN